MRNLTSFVSIFFVFAILTLLLFSQSSYIPPQRIINGQNISNKAEIAFSKNNLEEIKFVCKNSELKQIWLSLLQEREFINTLFTSGLQEEYNCSDMLDVKKIDLNDDDKPEYAVRVTSIKVCSATGNCPTAFYGFIDGSNSDLGERKGFRKFLFSLGMINFEIESSKTKGYKDILLRFNGSPYENYLELYQFNGNIYQRMKCFDESRQMKITSTKCWKDEN